MNVCPRRTWILFCFRHLEFEPRSQRPLSSYFEVGRERTLGTRLLEPSGSAVTPNLTSLGQKQNMFHQGGGSFTLKIWSTIYILVVTTG